MLIDSTRLGPIEIADESVITFPDGLLGFEQRRRFALIPADEVGAYSWLHSVEDPDLAFLVVVPAFFFGDYEPELPDADVEALELSGDGEAQALCLVTISGDDITANLLGPVVLNVRTQVARQIVLNEQGFSTRAPLGVG